MLWNVGRSACSYHGLNTELVGTNPKSQSLALELDLLLVVIKYHKMRYLKIIVGTEISTNSRFQQQNNASILL